MTLDDLLEKVWYDRTHKPDPPPPPRTRKRVKPKAVAKRRTHNKAARQARRRNR